MGLLLMEHNVNGIIMRIALYPFPHRETLVSHEHCIAFFRRSRVPLFGLPGTKCPLHCVLGEMSMIC